ncbi:membrane-spanning 4-domains subfamily A member 12-like isoform X2 [Hyperolius riggenbachi]
MIFTVVGYSLISGHPFWGGLTCVVTGILTMSSHSKQSDCLMTGSFGMNITSAIMSLCGAILACADLVAISQSWIVFHNALQFNWNGGIAVHSLSLVINLLILAVTISLAVFGGRALYGKPTYPIQIQVMLQNGVLVQIPASVVSTGSPPFMQ